MTLDGLFLQILNMSITGSYVILAILLVRLVLQKAPKAFSYALWSVAAFRLVSPVSFSSMISLFHLKPFNMSAAQAVNPNALYHVPLDIGRMPEPQIASGLGTAERVITVTLPPAVTTASANPVQTLTDIAALAWIIGLGALLIYGIISYVKVKRLVANAVRWTNSLAQSGDGFPAVEVFETDRIPSPFVLGFVRPRIYLPFCTPAAERDYILRHERHHIRRGDHLVKPLSFLILTVHWFNPLAWIAFQQMGRDMEMSCDEAVLRQMGTSLKHDYSRSLLSLATPRHFPAASPLAFGESNVKLRVMNVLNFRRPKTWVMTASLIVCVAIVLACAANPAVGAFKVQSPLDVIYDYVRKAGLDMTDNSAAMVDIQLPSSFDYVKDGIPVGMVLENGNSQSKESGLDFSAYLGRQVTLFTAEAKKAGRSDLFDFIILASDRTVIAFWPESGSNADGQVESDFTKLRHLESANGGSPIATHSPTDKASESPDRAEQRQTAEIATATRLVMNMLNVPHEQFRLAATGFGPNDAAAANQAIEQGVAELASGLVADSLVHNPGTRFRNTVIDLHSLAAVKGFTIKPLGVTFTPSATQKNLYSYEAEAVYSDDTFTNHTIRLLGRIQYDDVGKINFATIEGSDYQGIWDRFAPRDPAAQGWLEGIWKDVTRQLIAAIPNDAQISLQTISKSAVVEAYTSMATKFGSRINVTPGNASKLSDQVPASLFIEQHASLAAGLAMSDLKDQEARQALAQSQSGADLTPRSSVSKLDIRDAYTKLILKFDVSVQLLSEPGIKPTESVPIALFHEHYEKLAATLAKTDAELKVIHSKRSAPVFAQGEIDQAKKIVEQYFDLLSAKKYDAAGRLMSERFRKNNLGYETVHRGKIIVTALRYNPDDPARVSTLVPVERQNDPANVIAFRVDLSFTYPDEVTISEKDRVMLLTRKDKNAPWLLANSDAPSAMTRPAQAWLMGK